MTAVPADAPIVVVGAGAAGLAVVEALRHEGFDGAIVLVGEERHLPYDRPPLSKGFLLGALDEDRLTLRGPDALAALDVDLRLGRRAERLDLGGRRLLLDDGSELVYARLVVATGVRPRPLDGTHGGGGALALRTIDDSRAIRSRLSPSSRVVVVGGGFLGYEIAASARSTGSPVTIVDRGAEPLARQLGALAGEMVAQLHRSRGVEIVTGATVRRVDRTRSGWTAVLGDGRTIPADLVVAAVGSRPNTEWLSGSDLNVDDGVVCDSSGRAGRDVYAIGDVARWTSPGVAARRVEHRTNATDQALAVARHIVHRVDPAPVVPYLWSDQFDTRIQLAGSVLPGAAMEIVEADHEERRFIIEARRAGVVEAILGWRMPRRFAAHRARVGGGYWAA